MSATQHGWSRSPGLAYAFSRAKTLLPPSTPERLLTYSITTGRSSAATPTSGRSFRTAGPFASSSAWPDHAPPGRLVEDIARRRRWCPPGAIRASDAPASPGVRAGCRVPRPDRKHSICRHSSQDVPRRPRTKDALRVRVRAKILGKHRKSRQNGGFLLRRVCADPRDVLGRLWVSTPGCVQCVSLLVR